MQAFGWKRKAGLSNPRPAVFSEENVEERDGTEDSDVDWLTATKRPKVTCCLKFLQSEKNIYSVQGTLELHKFKIPFFLD